jgi:hypothetical protein
LVRVDAESDGGCTGPSDRSVSRSARDCPGHIGPQLVTLYASLPARAAVVSFTGHSDPRRVASLNAREVAFESAIKSGKKAEEIDRSEWWTASDALDDRFLHSPTILLQKHMHLRTDALAVQA